jgi:hypothetical protein
LLLLSFDEEAREAVLLGAGLEPLDPVAALEAALEEAEDDVALPVTADPSKAGVL